MNCHRKKASKERERKRWRGENDSEKKQIPQEQSPGGACVADVGRTKAYQMDHSNHFQLCIKLDPLPKYGLLTVSNKQLVIASMSSVRWSHVQQRDTSCKQNTSFVYVCLMNRRLSGRDKAGEDQGVTGEDWISRCIVGHSANNAPR